MARWRAEDPAPQTRRGRRKTVRTEVRFGDDMGIGDILLDSLNLSEGGAFIVSDLLFEVGEEFPLELKIPGTRKTIRSRGRVVRVDRSNKPGSIPGMGIQFVSLSDEDRDTLAEFVKTGRW